MPIKDFSSHVEVHNGINFLWISDINWVINLKRILSVIEFETGALFKVRQSPNVPLETKETFHISTWPVRRQSRPCYQFLEKAPRIACEFADSRRTRSYVERSYVWSGAARRAPFGSNQISTITSPGWFTSSGRKPARFTSVERGARPHFVPSAVDAAAVNPNCIIKI